MDVNSEVAGDQLNADAVDELVEQKKQQTFCQRVCEELKIIKNTCKATTVWRFFLYWLIRGITPSFSSFDYLQIRQVYKLQPMEYSVLKVAQTCMLLVGIAAYQCFFTRFEFRTNMYICILLNSLTSCFDLLIAYRVNIEYGVSDLFALCFSRITLGSLHFALEQLPSLVLF